jgi:hypothetical protein
LEREDRELIQIEMIVWGHSVSELESSPALSAMYRSAVLEQGGDTSTMRIEIFSESSDSHRVRVLAEKGGDVEGPDLH